MRHLLAQRLGGPLVVSPETGGHEQLALVVGETCPRRIAGETTGEARHRGELQQVANTLFPLFVGQAHEARADRLTVERQAVTAGTSPGEVRVSWLVPPLDCCLLNRGRPAHRCHPNRLPRGPIGA